MKEKKDPGFIIMQNGLFEINDFRKDHTLIAVYYFLLQMANSNKLDKTKCTIGTRQLATACNITDSKAYRVLLKLEKHQIVKREVKHDYTCFTMIYSVVRNANRNKSETEVKTNKESERELNNNKAEINPFWILDTKTAQVGLDEKMSDKTVRNEFKRFQNHHIVKKTLSENWLNTWTGWVLNWISFGSKQVSETGSKNDFKNKGGSSEAFKCWNQTHGNCNPFKTGTIDNEICGFCPGMKDRG